MKNMKCIQMRFGFEKKNKKIKERTEERRRTAAYANNRRQQKKRENLMRAPFCNYALYEVVVLCHFEINGRERKRTSLSLSLSLAKIYSREILFFHMFLLCKCKNYLYMLLLEKELISSTNNNYQL